jgi:hypothetical protein
MSQQTYLPVRRALFEVGGMFLAVAVIIASLKLGLIDHEMSNRLIMACVGILLIVNGNFMPKVLAPLGDDRWSEAKVQRTKRVVGFAQVLGGIGFTASWLLLPPSSAPAFAVSSIILSLLVGIACLVSNRVG